MRRVNVQVSSHAAQQLAECEEVRTRFVCTPVRNIVQLLLVVEVLAINRFVQSHHGFNQVRDDRNSANHTREEVIL